MDTGVKISIIVAVAENGVIGRGGDLPWHLGADLKRFKELTAGYTVIVGRKTHEAILKRLGRPLPDRMTIIITSQPHYPIPDGCVAVDSWEAALRLLGEAEKVFVIGGRKLYERALPEATTLYLTLVHARPDGDTFFPEYDRTEWPLTSATYHPQDEKNDYAHTFQVFKRLKKEHQGGGAADSPFVFLKHARYDDQEAVMSEIESATVCPFCPEHRKRFPLEPAVWQGIHWVLVPNRWPYKFTTLHLMAIPARHVCFPHELSTDEWSELREIISWAITAHSLRGGAIGIRFGDPRMTGASVAHLHAQLIVADQNIDQPGYQRVRFSMGPKSPQSQEKNNPES